MWKVPEAARKTKTNKREVNSQEAGEVEATRFGNKTKLRFTWTGQRDGCRRNNISSICSRFFHIFSSILWGGWRFASSIRKVSPTKQTINILWEKFKSRELRSYKLVILSDRKPCEGGDCTVSSWIREAMSEESRETSSERGGKG